MDNLGDDILSLLVDGPATVAQLEAATGNHRVDIHRALAGLFAGVLVEPVGDEWRLKRRVAAAAV